MKKITILFLLVFIVISCKTEVKELSITDKKSIETATNKVLDNWHKAATDANFEAYFNEMDSISVFIGTDATENWNKKQFETFSKPYFKAGKAWSFTTIERNIYINSTGDFVWFDELLNTWMGICRGSGVLEKSNNKWKIKHYVLSVSIPNDDINSVVLTKKKNDSIFLKSKLQ